MICDMESEAKHREYNRRLNFARQKAAQAWCAKSTGRKVMDTDLAEEFAKILVGEMYSTHLGLASTGELLDEIRARVDTEYKTIPDDGPR